MLVKMQLGEGDPTVTSQEQGYFPWDDPMSQPRDAFLANSHTLAETSADEPKAQSRAAIGGGKRKRRI